MRRVFKYLCPTCLAPDEGVGFYSSERRDKVAIWTCMAHIEKSKRIYKMNPAHLDQIDRDARGHADEAGGAYLMKIGKFDIREMTLEEADRYIDIVVTGFLDHRSAALGDEAPF